MGKGSKRRPQNDKKYGDNYDRIFGNKKFPIMDLPPDAEPDIMLSENELKQMAKREKQDYKPPQKRR